MTGRYSERLASGMPLLLCGAFMIYLAAGDGAIFGAVIDAAGSSRPAVAAATVLAAAPLMFFATGLLKMSLLHEWQTIHQYELLLRRGAFYAGAALVLAAVAALSVLNGLHLLNIHVVIGCITSAAYLARHAARL